MSLPSWGVYSLLYFLFFRITLAQPQTTAVCGPTFSWMNNTDGQSPCLVAAYAFSACTSTIFVIPSMTNPDATYGPPTGKDAVTSCGCSSVTYSLLTACSLCQGAQELDWSAWTQNCPGNDTANGNFPPNVSIGAQIPPWALQNILGEFNVEEAASSARVSSSSTSMSSTSSSVISSSISSTSSTSTTPASSSSQVFTSSSSTTSMTPSSSTPNWSASVSSTAASSSSISSITSTPPTSTAVITLTIAPNFTPAATSLTSSSPSASTPPSSSVVGDSTQDPRKTNLNTIIGGSVGGGIGLLIVVGLVAFSLHVRHKQKEEDKRMAPYRVDGLRLYDPEDETTYPKPEWPTAPAYSNRQSIVQLHDPGHRLVPNRPPAMSLIPEV